MPYRLLDHEPPGPGLRRIAIEQIRAATLRLDECQPDPQEAIHEVRKRLKKVRAILRLARGQLGEVLYAGENARHRDLGRLLAPLRDSHTRLEALRGLREHHPALIAHDAFHGMEKLLLADRSRLTAGFADGEIRRRALSALRGVEGAPAKWPVDGCSFDAIRPGLLRVYRQGRMRMKAAYARPSPDRFHDWRKRAKYLGYQLRILEPAWPADLGTTKKMLHDLTTLLGEAHDLSELEVVVREFEVLPSKRAWVEPLIGLIAGGCADLHARARSLGELVYVEEPEAFLERFAPNWSAWERWEASSGASA